jgi:small subunit ribosomal protein S21
MIEIKVESKDSLERSLKLLKRKFDRIGVVKELRRRKTFTKKSVERREEIRKAIRKKDWIKDNNLEK